MSLTLVGCTTKFDAATQAHLLGDFDGAAVHADRLCPTVEREGKIESLKVSYERDSLWVGLEKATILLDAGRLEDSIRLFAHVDDRSAFLRKIESAYLNNPTDPANWDIGQFSQDAGQAVLGADQTTFLLQPHEMILVRSYLALGMLLAGSPGAESAARAAQRYQEYEGVDLAKQGEKVAQPPMSRMDGVIRSSLKDGASTEFTVARVFSLGDFMGAKLRMQQAIDAAAAVRAGDPRVAFASAVAWASFMRSGHLDEAGNAADALAALSGAAETARAMKAAAQGKSPEFVLVLVDAGRGPVRRAFNVRVPIVIPNVGSTVFRAVYPELQFRTAERPSFVAVVAAGVESKAPAIDSVDALAAKNFRRREPELWWGPTVRAAIRATAAIVAQAAQDDDAATARLIIAIGSVLVAEAEQPDLRAWSTLPAAHHVALVPRPADGVIRVELRSNEGSRGIAEVSVPPGRSVVFVRAFTPQLHVSRVASIDNDPAQPAAALQAH